MNRYDNLMNISAARVASVLTIILSVLGADVTRAHAQEPPVQVLHEAFPVEVALTYDKLTGITPDYDALMALNPAVKRDPNRFGSDVLYQQRVSLLRHTYDDLNQDSVLMVKKRVTVKEANPSKHTITMEGLTPDEPIVFDLTATERYGIFLRNAKDVLTMIAPFHYEEYFYLQAYSNIGVTYPVQIVVKPVMADTVPFVMADGTSIKPIIADIVEITLFGDDGVNIAAVKRFDEWQPGGKSASLLDLKDNPLDHILQKELSKKP